MRYTVSIAVCNRADMTRACIDHLKSCGLPSDIEFIWSDNGSTDNSVEVILSSGLPHNRVIRYGTNLGFGFVHNEALQQAKGKYFIVMNNDIMIKDPNWLTTLTSPLEQPKMSVVGFAGNPASLRPDGRGHLGMTAEYVEASCLAVKTSFALRYGLFSPTIKKYYFEDSDMSLRYRQMGFKIGYVQVNHVHLRGATASTVQDPDKIRTIEHNNRVFIRRWEKYLQNRVFTNKILVRMHSLGAGDVLCMTPILSGLRRDHPTAQIEVETSFPEIFQGNPNINAIHRIGKRLSTAFDRIIQIDPEYRSNDLIVLQAETQAATISKGRRPQLFLTVDELTDAQNLLHGLRSEHKVVVGCALQMSRTEWQGRNWDYEKTAQLVSELKQMGVGTIELGKGVKSTGMAALDLVDRLSLRELFAVMSQIDIFVGIDSLPFHIAQAFGINSYVLFGATNPLSRIVDFCSVVPIQALDLTCVGCYQRGNAHPINRCNLGNEMCMSRIEVGDVLAYLSEEVDPMRSNIEFLQKCLRENNAA